MRTIKEINFWCATALVLFWAFAADFALSAVWLMQDLRLNEAKGLAPVTLAFKALVLAYMAHNFDQMIRIRAQRLALQAWDRELVAARAWCAVMADRMIRDVNYALHMRVASAALDRVILARARYEALKA